MRKINQECVDAFLSFQEYKNSNTQIKIYDDGTTVMLLHGNPIAQLKDNGSLLISLAGRDTTTTRSRLNAIPGVSVKKIKGVTMLNGQPMLDGWNYLENMI